MISEKDANLAREQYSDQLVALGAHAITVDEMVHNDKMTFGVVAYVEEPTDGMPEYLSLQKGDKKINIPVRVQVAEKFRPE